MSETIFTKVDHTLGSLMDAIELGTIGLPEIQRPFVWKNAKVRNLFDSMYQGSALARESWSGCIASMPYRMVGSISTTMISFSNVAFSWQR